MTKPMDLTIYPTWENSLDGTCYSDREGLDFPINVDYWILCKRLTDAELAAEYWHAWADMLDVPKAERYPHEPDRIATLRRFATLPHHDEAPGE